MSLFEEAVLDATKLREVAEQNAKDKILASITPKIRQIIEQELVSDQVSDDESLDDEIALTMDDILVEPGDEGAGGLEGKIDIDVQGDATFAFSTQPVSIEDEDEDEDEEILTLNQESARALAMMLKTPSTLRQSKIIRLQEKIRTLDRVLGFIEGKAITSALRESVRKSYMGLIKEVTSLRRRAILTKRANERNLLRSRFNGILKEFKTMSRRRAETLFDRLFETKRSLSELDIVLGDEDLETLGVEDVEDVDVTTLDVSVEYAGGEEEVEEEEVGEEEVEVEEGDMYEDEELDELDLVLDDEDLETLGVEDTEDVDVTTLDVGVEYAGGEEEEVEVGEEEEEEVLEISESMLRRELRRMRRLREQEEAADADPYLGHGGEDLGDVFVDVDEDDLLNALADELGDPGVPTPTVESRRRRRARRQPVRRRRPARISESRTRKTLIKESRKNRALTGKLGKTKRAISAMKNQLNEMNLFNAKLLYVNKLMQNRNLSTRQQKAIVEALDSAKTLREAKLLYKSLTVSLKKRGGTLTEGRIARTLGSSSRSIRSASPSKSGTEVDRWAVLAGINQD